MAARSEPPPTVFVISPIGEVGTVEHKHASLVLDYIIRKALPTVEFIVIRADDETRPDSISDQIIRRIVESDLIVAVLTDRNPNVFYELAIAHGFNRPVISLIVEGQVPPFDVNDQRTIFYDLTNPASVDDARNKLRASVDHVIAHPEDAPRNPVSAFRQFAAIERSSSPATANEALADSLSLILARVSKIDERISGPRPVPTPVVGSEPASNYVRTARPTNRSMRPDGTPLA